MYGSSPIASVRTADWRQCVLTKTRHVSGQHQLRAVVGSAFLEELVEQGQQLFCFSRYGHGGHGV